MQNAPHCIQNVSHPLAQYRLSRHTGQVTCDSCERRLGTSGYKCTGGCDDVDICCTCYREAEGKIAAGIRNAVCDGDAAQRTYEKLRVLEVGESIEVMVRNPFFDADSVQEVLLYV